jgi:hypothetical protein
MRPAHLVAVGAVTLSLLAGTGTPAYAGAGWKKTVKRLFKRPFTRTQVIVPGDDRTGFLHPLQHVDGIAVFGKNDAKDPSVQRSSYELGEQIAIEGFAIATGGGKGLPKLAEDGAFFRGGHTVAFTPQGSFDAHKKSHDGDTKQTTHLVLVGTGGGTGAIAREAPMAESVRAGIYVNGGSGTFGELMALLHNPRGVVGLLKGSGGVADFAEKGILPYAGLPSGRFAVRVQSDSRQLVKDVAAAYRKLPAEAQTSGSQRLINPGKPQRILSDEQREDRVVASLFSQDPRMSKEDSAAVSRLAELWSQQAKSVAKKGGVLVVPIQNNAQEPGLEGVDSEVVFVKPYAPPSSATPSRVSADGRQIAASKQSNANSKRSARFLGLGESNLNAFINAREASQDADVVFLTSAHYTNLSALAYALRDDRKPIIAVLRSKSTHGDKIGPMVEAIDAKAYGKRFVEADTPEELVEKVKAAVEKRGKVAISADAKSVD